MAKRRNGTEWNAEEIARLIDTYEKPLQDAVTRQIGHAEDARDIVQEAFARFYFTDQEVETETYARNWLFNVARNLGIDRGRRRHRRPASLDRLHEDGNVDLPDANQEPPEVVLGKREEEEERNQFLREALIGLPRQYGMVLWMRYYLGLKRADIAHALGIKEQDVSNRQHRGLQKLREQLLAGAAG